MPKDTTAPIIFWFRQDLRLSDNPGLTEAAKRGAILPIYVLDDANAGDHQMGGASRWWLHHSLRALNERLGGTLACFQGDASDILPQLIEQTGARAVYWNRCYEPWRIKRDTQIKERLSEQEVDVQSFNASLLWEPWEIQKQDGGHYKVFTPFYRKGCLNAPPPRQPLPAPADLHCLPAPKNALPVDGLKLLPAINWDAQLAPHWTIGEQGAQEQLDSFLNTGLHGYKEGRNCPPQPHVSRLSPYLHFGDISPHQLWYAIKHHGEAMGWDKDTDHFLSEVGWREFSYHLLYYYPDLPTRNLQTQFDRFPWQENDKALHRWQRGQTGYPIVDAGMRELWQTGYMHNRVRMIVASFLVKNLLLHWHHGERWFWDCLVDADLANNSASWQWVAGCGADAAPYFRIFNPVMQGHKFDPKGDYTRRWVPELAGLPDKYLFSPWDAPEDIRQQSGVKLGDTYPHPIVDLKPSRERALSAYQSLRTCS